MRRSEVFRGFTKPFVRQRPFRDQRTKSSKFMSSNEVTRCAWYHVSLLLPVFATCWFTRQTQKSFFGGLSRWVSPSLGTKHLCTGVSCLVSEVTGVGPSFPFGSGDRFSGVLVCYIGLKGSLEPQTTGDQKRDTRRANMDELGHQPRDTCVNFPLKCPPKKGTRTTTKYRQSELATAVKCLIILTSV